MGQAPATLAPAADGRAITILDQTRLPHEVVTRTLTTVDEVAEAIVAMRVRGAPLIGLTAAWGLVLALHDDDGDHTLGLAEATLLATRPTAVNLAQALGVTASAARATPRGARAEAAAAAARALMAAEVVACRAIGDHGLALLQGLGGGAPVRVLTHCNAGWLATLEYGTALAPVYRAHESDMPVQVWVDETRPRGQGWLTAWELGARGVPHTVVSDTTAGHLLQRGEVDVVLVGTDRTTRCGDVCNKIGTWPLALAAREAGVPFWAAVPSSSIDWACRDWRTIPIEERDGDELRLVRGRHDEMLVAVAPGAAGSAVRNVAFDVTPAPYVTGLLTERGPVPATEAGLLERFPERR